MGLAGRKEKQRIPADPRNLSWVDDASRFGLSYLSKFGWDASQGLGVSGQGAKTHLKVHQKLDMMGIGAQHQRDPDGIAWKQNKEFETLLKRLNEHVTQETSAYAEGESTAEHEVGTSDSGPRDHVFVKKRKYEHRDDSSTSENTKKKRKEKHQSDIPLGSSSDPLSVSSLSGPCPEPISRPRQMAHRARIRAAKRIADKSASAISEILGIAPCSFVSTSTSTPVPTPPSSVTPFSQPSLLSLDNLTTSRKSVADYFKEKLARSTTSSASPSITPAPSGSASPDLGTTGSKTGVYTPEDSNPPRKGIGCQVLVVPLPSEVPRSAEDGSNNNNGRDLLTEKIRRKAERKAERQKRREADQPTCKSSAREQAEEDNAQCAREAPVEEKRKRRQEQSQQGPTDNNSITRGDCHNRSSPKSKKKIKRNSKSKVCEYTFQMASLPDTTKGTLDNPAIRCKYPAHD